MGEKETGINRNYHFAKNIYPNPAGGGGVFRSEGNDGLRL